MGQWLVFGWFWSWGTLDMQLARQKLGKNTHPIHGGRHCPMAAMAPSPRHRRVQQFANMLRNKPVVKTREYYCFYYVFISFFKAQRIVDAPCLSVCWLRQRAALRVSYSHRVALRIILSASGTESMMLSACAESMIVSAPPAASMIHTLSTVWLYYYDKQCLNGTADRTAAKGGQVLPHFQQIVSGASMPLCPIAAVFNSSASGQSVIGWSVHNKGSQALGGFPPKGLRWICRI